MRSFSQSIVFVFFFPAKVPVCEPLHAGTIYKPTTTDSTLSYSDISLSEAISQFGNVRIGKRGCERSIARHPRYDSSSTTSHEDAHRREQDSELSEASMEPQCVVSLGTKRLEPRLGFSAAGTHDDLAQSHCDCGVDV